MSDYTEHLISQAGGDGEIPIVILYLNKQMGTGVEIVQFTNVDAADVKRAINLLNGDIIPGPYYTCQCGHQFPHLASLIAHRDNPSHPGVGHPIYADTDSLSTIAERNAAEFAKGRLWSVGDPVELTQVRTEDFTVNELFTERGFVTEPCNECGSLVNRGQRETHTTWHNKLLP